MQFGIIGTANIAVSSFLPGIERTEHEVGAIGSRSLDHAESVADEHSIPRVYGDYESLLEDEGIDAVYNPLPNSLHAEWTKRAADAGLDVLCEKPLGVDADEAREMFDHCEARDVTLMEAFMYRFHPRTERAVAVVAEEFDDVRSMTATFKFRLEDESVVQMDPDLAGGSLMDIGAYAINATRLFLGQPDRVYGSLSDTRDSGVDTEMAALLEYDDGAVARVASGFDTQPVEGYRVDATNGWLKAERSFGPGPDEEVSITYSVDGRQATETFDPVDHYALEIEGFADCVASGDQPRVDRAETVENMATIDAIRESAERGEAVSPSASK
jgi:predicted dehydrogenase